jgi:transcription termination factor NusB
MEILKHWDLSLDLVKTKKGAILYKISVSENHFFLEQNPLKNSKYGVAYRALKEKYPEFYMFWEIKDNKYTGKLLTGVLLEKEDIDQFIVDVIKNEEFKEYEDIREEIENK